MIRFKTENLRAEWHDLRHRNPALWAMVSACAAYAAAEHDQNTVITSIYRDDPDSVHGHARGVDVRIYHPDRVALPEDGLWNLRTAAEAGWTLAAAEDTIQWAEQWMEYEDGSSDVPDIAVIHGEGLDEHVHFQLGKWSAL